LQLCNIAYSPLANDFRFKVKTQVIAKKTEQEIFLEKIKSLGGAEFIVEVPSDKGKTRGRKEQVYVGKLNSQASCLQTMVLNIPNIFPDDQKKAREALNFLMDESRPKISEIRANMKGDEVKVSWLKKAIDKVTDPRARDKPVNERLGEFIFDASKARPIHDSEKLSEDSEYFWELKKNELLKLNKGQRKAVLAAIHCQDLALLQGPPGTGKTTVIAEMIWQMIRQNPQHKILLTSETNLAVDNALDRLLNTKGVNQDLVRYTTLIKPLRFGKMAKMDEEGAKYSAERIDTWASSVSSELPNEHMDELDEGREGDPEDNVEKNSPENNAVQDWMKRIATRAQHHNPKYAKVLKNWTQDLAMPSTEAKQLFRDKYFEYANVVGSTCTSTGSKGFSQGYQRVFNKTKGYHSNAQDKKNWLKIQFDTVIMDEASKATPPELLLPLCFAGRSIIIGDHRQLPPMLHEKDFKEALEAAGAHNLAEDIDREFTETSQFERLILNPQVPPEIISRCNIQYRMHPHITEVIKQFYIEVGGLEPAPELEQHANDADLGHIFSRHHGLYASGLVDAHTHTIWVDVKTPETREGTSVVNVGEVEAIRQVIEQLKNAKGFEEFQQHWAQTIQDEFKRKQAQEIGVISFYGAQKRLIKQSLKGMGVPLKINTVDRFQGMERNIVIVSTVRSEQQAGFGGKISPNRSPGFAKSPQRLNVALSRARRLLIVVGNKDFFSKVKDSNGKYLYRNSINAIKKYGRVVDFDNFVNQH
jgi:superfamily I DNA and/or RNA helicase